MKILIDNGHGSNTPGKCSPDKRLLEYRYCREIAKALVEKLKAAGYDADRIVTEDNDISLAERSRRVNAVCRQLGPSNVLLVSIHINAAGADGKWHDARGWSVWVRGNASFRSRNLAQTLYAEAEVRGLRGNRYVPNEKYWSANFTILTATNCPAALTENLFQDNLEDVAFLLSPAGRKAIVDLHFDAITRYVNQNKR